MLTIQLTLPQKSDCVSVAINAVESHSFLLSELAFSPAQAEAFFDNPASYGKRLYRALFPPASQAEKVLKALPGGQRLFLHLTGAALTSLPWEYCFDGQRYLATEYGFARCVPGETPLAEAPLAERLRFLFVPADPLLHGAEVAPYRLGLEREWDDLLKDLRASDPAVDLIQVQPPTFAALQTAAAGMRAGILHFTGHGVSEKDKAYLLFEKPSGAAELVEAAHLAALVRGKAALVVLSACQSAAPGQGVEANLAALLSAQGLPFVLGMQLSVPDRSARAFTDMFYHHLFAGEDVYEAARQARLAILQAGSALEMGIPVLYSADPARPAALKPAGKGLQVAAPPRINLEGLPTAAESGFFGRQRELAQVGKLLTDERLRDGESYPPLTVTLHGPGGIGKTALLLKAAARFAWAFEDGVLAVPLEPPPTPESLCERLEKFTGLPEVASLERAVRLERLSHHLQGRSLLLALDNFESLLHARAGADAAKKGEAAAIFKFLRGLPARGLTLLVSSRAPSGLPGEKSVEIPGLDDSAGARLFAAGVSGRKSALETQALKRLSRRVGGHPLALKLLAPRFDGDASLGLVDFIDQLESLLPAAADEWDEGQRHDTLRACFDFSLEALQKSDPALVNALARLSVFSAAFPAWLAAPVLFWESYFAADADRNALVAAAAQHLHRLWEYGQLEREVAPLNESALTFYNLHPALRPFAAARLREDEKPAALEGLFTSMQYLGQICYPFKGKEEGSGIYARYDLALTAYRALPDLRRAAGMKSDSAASNLRFHSAFLLTHFGDLAGAMQLYQQALAIDEGLGDLKGKSATLHQMAGIFVTRGDLAGAMQLYQQALAIDEGLGDLKGKSATLHAMANVFVTRGDLAGAMQLYQQSLEIKEGLGDLQGKSATLHQMAGIFVTRGDLAGAMQLYQQALAILEGLGDLKGKSATLHQMAGIFVTRGDLAGAMQLYQQSLEIKEGLGDLKGKSATLHAMANVFVTRGDLAGAMQLYQQALAIDEGLGDLKGKSATLHAMANVFVTRGDLAGAMQLYQQSLEIKEGLGDLKGKSATLHQMAGIFVTRGDLAGAMQLYQQALAILEGLGDLQGKSATLANMAGIFVTRGDLAGAMQLYQQALAILEGLGDLQGKSATLHQMAGIFVTRGDLAGAMQLYQQALAIDEGLGDLQGKASTLNNMGVVLFQNNQFAIALPCFVESLATFEKMGAHPSVQTVANLLVQFRQALGAAVFDPLWREVTGGAPIPEWLEQAPSPQPSPAGGGEQEQGMLVEQFIAGAVGAAKKRLPEADGYFKSASQLAANTSAPSELRALGAVLRRILGGDLHPDLASLPPELAAVLRRILGGDLHPDLASLPPELAALVQSALED